MQYLTCIFWDFCSLRERDVESTTGARLALPQPPDLRLPHQKCSIRRVNSLLSLQPQPPLELPVLPEEEEEEIQGVRWCRCYFDRLRFYQNAEWLFLAGSLSTGRRKKVVAWALHVFIPGGYRGAPLFPSGSDVWEPPAPQKCNTTFFRVSRGVMVLQGSKYSCVQKKKKRNHWKRHRFEWVFIETEVSKG